MARLPGCPAARTLLMYRHMRRMDSSRNWCSLAPEALGVDAFSTLFGPRFFNGWGNLCNWDRMAVLLLPCVGRASASARRRPAGATLCIRNAVFECILELILRSLT
jgi:hypothetical protein